MKVLNNIVLYTLVGFIFAESDLDIKGQLVGSSLLIHQDNNFQLDGYLQYISIAEYQKYYNNVNIAFDISGNFFSNLQSIHEGKLYRAKLSVSNEQSELRLGLQKIAFGPAQILRSLQWFDRVSPTDPLKLTHGVYGILFRHYVGNNNFWFWILYQNKKLKAWEITKTKSNTPEFGGRMQIPIPNGEFGSAIHSRKVDKKSYSYWENKIGFDSRWDIFIGFWFESTLQYSDSEKLDNQWQKMNTIGMDYTFSVGNGLYVVAENMSITDSNKLWKQNINYQFSSIMLTYPMGLFDNFMAVSFYSWKTKKFTQYIGWRRAYDNFIFDLNLGNILKGNKNTIYSEGSGYSLEFKIIYNH